MLFVEKFWNNDEFTAEITTSTGKSIKGLIGSQLTFRLQHSWSSWDKEVGDTVLKHNLRKALAAAGALVGGDIGKFLSDLAQASLRSIYQTVLFWKGAEIAGFSVTLIVVNWDGNHNPLQTFKELMELGLPTREGMLLKPPHDYRVDIQLKSDTLTGGEGTLGFRYSNWFFAEQYFVLGGCTSRFSYEKCQDGSPLYGEFTIDLEPCMEVTKNVFLKWVRV